MKLTLKIMLLFLIVACGLVTLSGYLSVQREIAFLDDETSARHERLFAAVEPMLLQVRNSSIRGDILRFVTAIEGDEQQVRIRWVWLDDSADAATRPVADRLDRDSLLTRRLTSVRVRAPDGSGLFCSYKPMDLGGERLGALELVESLDRFDQYTRSTITRTIILMAAMIVSAMLAVALVGLRIVGRPLQALIHKTQRVADGDLLTPVFVAGSDELATLATALNQMCEKLDDSQQAVLRESARRIEALGQLRHDDRLKTVGRLASGVAHELGTPLNVVSGRAGLIAGGSLDAQEIASSARTIHSEAARMTGIVQQLLNFARRSAPRRAPCSLNSIIELTISLMEPLIRKNQARVEFIKKLPDGGVLQADAAQIQQVVSNLLTNAMQSRDSGAEIQITAETCESAAPQSMGERILRTFRITVTDNGEGIKESDLPHVFEPFFTTREVGQGTGLGLSIAYGIAAEHGGWMTAESTFGHGTSMSLFLPAESLSTVPGDTQSRPEAVGTTESVE